MALKISLSLNNHCQLANGPTRFLVQNIYFLQRSTATNKSINAWDYRRAPAYRDHDKLALLMFQLQLPILKGVVHWVTIEDEGVGQATDSSIILQGCIFQDAIQSEVDALDGDAVGEGQVEALDIGSEAHQTSGWHRAVLLGGEGGGGEHCKITRTLTINCAFKYTKNILQKFILDTNLYLIYE